jgi:hypothetical protein
VSPDAATLQPSPVSLREAAAALGVSEAAVRRMVKAGALRATREPRPQGHVWRVHLPGHLMPAPDALGDASPDGTCQPPRPSPAASGGLPLASGSLELLRAEALAAYAAAVAAPHLQTIERLSAERAALAQQVGELQERVRQLEAPRPAEAAGEQVDVINSTRPWWARLAWWRR